jgi:hypothetical protein
MAIIAGGLGVGEFLTPIGIVMAGVGAVLGYRTVPPTRGADNSQKLNE